MGLPICTQHFNQDSPGKSTALENWTEAQNWIGQNIEGPWIFILTPPFHTYASVQVFSFFPLWAQIGSVHTNWELHPNCVNTSTYMSYTYMYTYVSAVFKPHYILLILSRICSSVPVSNNWKMICKCHEFKDNFNPLVRHTGPGSVSALDIHVNTYILYIAEDTHGCLVLGFSHPLCCHTFYTTNAYKYI